MADWVGASVAVIERHYAHVIPATGDDLTFLEGPNTDRSKPNTGKGSGNVTT
jgi:hypothetical protein